MRKWLLALVVAAAFLMAQASPGFAAIEKGDQELTVGFSMIHTSLDEGDDYTTVTLTAGFGVFVTNEIQVKGALYGSWLLADTDTVLYSLEVQGLWHFMTEKEIVPYAGLGAGLSGIEADEFDDSYFSLRAILGVKFFLNESTTIFVEYNYLWVDEDAIDGIHLLLVGLSYFF